MCCLPSSLLRMGCPGTGCIVRIAWRRSHIPHLLRLLRVDRVAIGKGLPAKQIEDFRGTVSCLRNMAGCIAIQIECRKISAAFYEQGRSLRDLHSRRLPNAVE